MDQFKIETALGMQDGIRIIRLSGPFTLPETFDFQTVFRGSEAPVTLIDLTGVSYLDSAALGALLSVHVSSEKHRRRYALVGAQERLRDLFRSAEVESLLVMYRTIEEAQTELADPATAKKHAS